MYYFPYQGFPLKTHAIILDFHNDDSNNKQPLQYLRTTTIKMSSTTIDNKHPGDFVIRDFLLEHRLLM